MNKPTLEDSQREIAHECDALKALLLEKNAAYGNSVFDPVTVFARGLTPLQQVRVRIDDKLKRIANGAEQLSEDTVFDLIGYLVLLRVGQKLGVQ